MVCGLGMSFVLYMESEKTKINIDKAGLIKSEITYRSIINYKPKGIRGK